MKGSVSVHHYPHSLTQPAYSHWIRLEPLKRDGNVKITHSFHIYYSSLLQEFLLLSSINFLPSM